MSASKFRICSFFGSRDRAFVSFAVNNLERKNADGGNGYLGGFFLLLINDKAGNETLSWAMRRRGGV